MLFAKEVAEKGAEGIIEGSKIKDLFRYFLKARLRAALRPTEATSRRPPKPFHPGDGGEIIPGITLRGD